MELYDTASSVRIEKARKHEDHAVHAVHAGNAMSMITGPCYFFRKYVPKKDEIIELLKILRFDNFEIRESIDICESSILDHIVDEMQPHYKQLEYVINNGELYTHRHKHKFINEDGLDKSISSTFSIFLHGYGTPNPDFTFEDILTLSPTLKSLHTQLMSFSSKMEFVFMYDAS